VRDDIFRLLEESVGVPEYYQWRSRSGCYFCFFQRQDEWLGLKRKHPKLFEKAREFENRVRTKYDPKEGEIELSGHGYTWSTQGTLDELVQKAKVREENGMVRKQKSNERWQDILKRQDDDSEDQACLICSL
jgi:hypothetical protein